MKLILTCEHGGNEIPEQFVDLFGKAEEVLNSHRGYDLGALDLFEYFQKLSDFSIASTTSRLLIELNRSIEKPDLFSEFTQSLSNLEKEDIIKNFYLPYRNVVENHIAELIGRGESLLHLSIHTFTPIFNGEVRNADLGLLYDPSIYIEKKICEHLKTELIATSPNLRVKFNYPYLGTADGFTTHLRTKFPDNYIGIEIEVNQKYSSKNKIDPYIAKSIFNAIQNVLK
ncbi:Predicted N-formylglutamate amidohydrolase [Gillisia sp. Hel1_33_143]|uniref:N-formylglutamate amidohydrolase n=1 Tax=Gillisia sp. Hel1_33_143 TaxID=1336796 RepID=UPI00087AD909|nr:N-formylglutamate amidohydrolase [Gillisia sp. Hel1_33_143]SDS61186.1 Predicted N-formylglutamate amidohydrolase [Gillisia sp. Hel1_33_143]